MLKAMLLVLTLLLSTVDDSEPVGARYDLTETDPVYCGGDCWWVIDSGGRVCVCPLPEPEPACEIACYWYDPGDCPVEGCEGW